MENRAHALIAGLFFIFLGLGVLVAVWWLSGTREPMREVLLVTQRSVSGLNPQAQVRFRGVRCGKVQEISLDPNDPSIILVRASIRRDIPLSAATTAELKPQGITGLTYIELQNNGSDSGGPAITGYGAKEVPRIALKPSSVEVIGEDVGATLATLRGLASRISLAVSDKNLERLSNTLGHVENATGNLAATTENLPQVMVSVRQAISPENVQRITKLIDHLEKTGRDAGPLVADLRALLSSAQTAVNSIEKVASETGGEINETTLPQVNAAISDMARTSRRVTRMVEQLESEPQSFIFGPSAPRPGPGEPGFIAPAGR